MLGGGQGEGKFAITKRERERERAIVETIRLEAKAMCVSLMGTESGKKCESGRERERDEIGVPLGQIDLSRSCRARA